MNSEPLLRRDCARKCRGRSHAIRINYPSLVRFHPHDSASSCDWERGGNSLRGSKSIRLDLKFWVYCILSSLPQGTFTTVKYVPFGTFKAKYCSSTSAILIMSSQGELSKTIASWIDIELPEKDTIAVVSYLKVL